MLLSSMLFGAEGRELLEQPECAYWAMATVFPTDPTHNITNVFQPQLTALAGEPS